MTTPKPILVFCADLQARESAYRSIKELSGDDLYALSQVVSYCDMYNLPLLLGGDQVDTPLISDEHTVKLRRQLMRISPNNTWYVDGNHERGFKRLCLEGGQAAAANNLEQGYAVKLGNQSVMGYNWRTRRQWEEYLDTHPIKASDIIVLHGFASQVVPALGLPPDEAPLCDIDLNWFDGKAKVVLMGDIHMEWEWLGPKGTRFLYSGSMWMHRLGEPEAKSFIVVYDDLSIKRIPLKCRPFLRTNLSSMEDAKRIELWLDLVADWPYKAEMQEFMGALLPRLHIVIPPGISLELAAAIESIKTKAFVFEKVETSHDRDLTEVQGSLSEALDLTTALGKLLDIKDEDQAIAAEFVRLAMETGFDHSVSTLKQKVGI